MVMLESLTVAFELLTVEIELLMVAIKSLTVLHTLVMCVSLSATVAICAVGLFG